MVKVVKFLNEVSWEFTEVVALPGNVSTYQMMMKSLPSLIMNGLLRYGLPFGDSMPVVNVDLNCH